jgi:Rad3-related DNA helicase
MVAILDPRLKTRRYGQTFLKALPECRPLADLQSVKSFFQSADNPLFPAQL